MSGPSREGWTMRATTDHRVRRARLLIATAAGGVSGAVAGPLFDLLVPGPFTPSVTLFAVVFGAVVGCLSGLLAAVLLNLTLPRTHARLTPASATLALTALRPGGGAVAPVAPRRH